MRRIAKRRYGKHILLATVGAVVILGLLVVFVLRPQIHFEYREELVDARLLMLLGQRASASKVEDLLTSDSRLAVGFYFAGDTPLHVVIQAGRDDLITCPASPWCRARCAVAGQG